MWDERLFSRAELATWSTSPLPHYVNRRMPTDADHSGAESRMLSRYRRLPQSSTPASHLDIWNRLEQHPFETFLVTGGHSYEQVMNDHTDVEQVPQISHPGSVVAEPHPQAQMTRLTMTTTLSIKNTRSKRRKTSSRMLFGVSASLLVAM
jgi:hypothetical protein